MSPAIARLMALGVVVTLTVGAAPLPRIQFTDTKPRNGLRVIISEDHSAPVFTLAVTYNAGSRDERKGRTGFAHLFEHMMFKGSENVGALEHPHLVFAAGGIMDATTNKDRTLYFATLPSNQLDLGLFLEADRMRSLEITQANFENQRAAVKEERLLRVDNQPYGRTFEVIEDLAYENFAYEHSVIGSMQDLDAATVDDAAAFFKTYYAPNNAVLSIVGDVDTKVALEKVKADPYAASMLGMPVGAPLFRVVNLLRLGGVPVDVDDIRVPASLFRGLTERRARERKVTLYQLYQADFGVTVLRTEERMRAVKADATTAPLLAVAKGEPLLKVIRRALSFSDRPVELRFSYISTARHEYNAEPVALG